MELKLRRFQRGDEEAISKLHNETVRERCKQHYNQVQIDAWSPIRTSFESLAKSLEDTISYVVEINNKIVGFGDLESDGRMKRLYTDKDFQGKGVGKAIFKKLEEEARALGLQEVYLESSLNAKSFYEKEGCIAGPRIVFVEMHGVKIPVWPMRKRL